METATPQITLLHRTLQTLRRKHRTPWGLRTPQHRKLRLYSSQHCMKKCPTPQHRKSLMSPSFRQGNNITTTVGMRLWARSKGMGVTKFKGRRVLGHFAELVSKKLLMFQHCCFLFFQRNTHYMFNFTHYGQQLVIIGMTIVITNITQSGKHRVRSKTGL